MDKQIQVEVKELNSFEMRGTIQGCSYGERLVRIPVSINLEAPFIKTIEKIWEYEKKIDGKINRFVIFAQKSLQRLKWDGEFRYKALLLKYRYLKNESWEDIFPMSRNVYRTVHRIHASALKQFCHRNKVGTPCHNVAEAYMLL